MFLIKEIEFIDYNDDEVIMINLINGATDIIERNIYELIINKDFEKIDSEILNCMLERRYLFNGIIFLSFL